MDNLTNKEPGIKDSTVQDSVSKEQKKKENRPVIGAKAQTILEFLRACSPYEADSIRVMVGYGMGKGDIETIEATDMLAVNRFLNHGLTCENGTSSEAVMKHLLTYSISVWHPARLSKLSAHNPSQNPQQSEPGHYRSDNRYHAGKE